MNIFKQLALSKTFSRGTMRYSRALSQSFLHSSPGTSLEVCSPEHEVVIALGSNVGDRVHNFNEALTMLKNSGINITRHSCLYETAPAYVTDQPFFLNSAVRGVTKLGPNKLLKTLKKIEKEMGRTDGIRYGPRPLDLDILFYGKLKVSSGDLTIPHERIWERPFVMAPLVDLLGSAIDSETVASWHSLSKHSLNLFEAWEKLGGESLIGKDGMRRVLPVGDRLWDWSKKTSIMGVLNLTPDSFSDGGKYESVENAVSQARGMISEGADIIDLGAQSTRPNATRISAQDELRRLIPVLQAVKEMPEAEGKLISADTFYSEVASEAVKNGAHIVNDVSAGKLDKNMFNVIAGLRVPYIAMHMRGDPDTMQSKENIQYDDICKDVASELIATIKEAELSGIPAWRIVLDPGIGFSKNTEQNLDILLGVANIREEIRKKNSGVSRGPMLIGPSRKRFLGEICDLPKAFDRDPPTVAAITTGVLGGANIVRVHNVRDCLSATKLCDAMIKRGMFSSR